MTPVSAGDEIDCYRIESMVARGGMATIFRAVDMRDGRTVPSRCASRSRVRPGFFDRFQREILMAGNSTTPAQSDG